MVHIQTPEIRHSMIPHHSEYLKAELSRGKVAFLLGMRLARSANLPSAVRCHHAFLAFRVAGFPTEVPTACGADHLWIFIQRSAN